MQQNIILVCYHLYQIPRASYQLRKIASGACTGNAGSVFPATDFKGNRQIAITASRHVRDARAVMHDWIANPPVAGETFSASPAHAQPTILRIW